MSSHGSAPSAGEPLFRQEVDWSGWAAHADPLVCPACETRFQPNHPRRRFCGRPTCPGRKRRRTSTVVHARTSPPARPPAPRRRRPPTPKPAHPVHGLVADAMVALSINPPTGTARELALAARDLFAAAAHGRPPEIERGLIVRLLSVAVARSQQQGVSR